MAFTLVYTKSAVTDIKKLDGAAKRIIKKKITYFAQNPLRLAKKLIHSSLGSYRWRIGNYRVVFDMDGKTIVILRVGHRREIYR